MWQELMQKAKLSAEQISFIHRVLTFVNQNMGKRGDLTPPNVKWKESKPLPNSSSEPEETGDEVVNRNSITFLLQQLIEDQLPEKYFPYVRNHEQSKILNPLIAQRRTHQAVFAANNTAQENSPTETQSSVDARIIIFIVGGMTFGEIRSVYEYTSTYKRDVLIGSTSVLTPSLFIESLKSACERMGSY